MSQDEKNVKNPKPSDALLTELGYPATTVTFIHQILLLNSSKILSAYSADVDQT